MKCQNKNKKIDAFPYLLILPAFIMILAITFYPFISSLIMSFYDFSFTKIGANFIGLKNYFDIISEGKFLSSIVFTITWTVANIILMSILGFIMMLLLKQKFFGKQFLKATILIPWVLPQIVTGFIWSLMLSQNMGIINEILSFFGIVGKDFSWFSNGSSAFWAVLFANSWRGFPFFALMLYAKLQSVPESQIEAAQIDGANHFQVFKHISVPYIKPVYITCVMLTFLWTFNAFDIIKVMTNGGPIEKTVSLSLLVQREAFDYMEISRASAMAVLMFIVIMILASIVFYINKMIVRRHK